MPHRDPEHPGRRVDDRQAVEAVATVAVKAEQVATTLDHIIAWGNRWKWVVMTIAAVVIAASGLASWAGATRSAPGQRIDLAHDRIDSLGAEMTKLGLIVTGMQGRADSTAKAFNGRFTLLLRINCRSLAAEFRDLLDDCRDVGATR
jgi:hypothetical protein